MADSKNMLTGDALTSKRVTVTLRPSDLDRISRIAEATHQSANEVIRRALATEAFLVDSRSREEKVLLQDREGETRVIEFLY